MIGVACMLIGFGCKRERAAGTAAAGGPRDGGHPEGRPDPAPSGWARPSGFVNAQVMPRVQGYLLKQDYEDGANVKAGQLLFEIDDRPYKAVARPGARRPRDAAGDSPEEPAGRRALHAARRAGCRQQAGARRRHPGDARQRGAGAGGRGGRRRTRASTSAGRRSTRPIDGIAGIAPVQVGDLVTPSTVLTTVSQVDPMKVTFPITEREYLALRRPDQGASGEGPGAGRAGASAHPGRRQHVSPSGPVPRRQSADRPTRPGRSSMQALFPNPDGILRPGLYAKVRARHGDRPGRAPRAGARGAGDPGHVPGGRRRTRTTRSRSAR